MILCGVDIETSGLDKEVDHITEIGWSIKRHGIKRPLIDKRFYVRGATTIPDKVKQLTEIYPHHCEVLGKDLGVIINELLLDIRLTKAEAFVAHNVAFDRTWLEHKAPELTNTIPWIDTLHDIDWSKTDVRSRHLPYLCAEYGFINPFPHNAMADVWAMLRVLDEFEIAEVYERSKSPMVTVAALVDFEQKDKAKEQKYRWQSYNDREYPKRWVKVIKECDLDREQEVCKTAGFEIRIIDRW